MKYDHIINLERPASSRPKMSSADRAAQLSAFAALVGLDEQMDETARLVNVINLNYEAFIRKGLEGLSPNCFDIKRNLFSLYYIQV